MLEKLSLRNCATYVDLVELELAPINYFYGGNGSGKTTISRVINAPTEHPECTLHWKADRALETRVYNQDWVDRNFRQSERMPGVFTLGEESVETTNKIASLADQNREIDEQLEKLRGVLGNSSGEGGKYEERAKARRDFSAECWSVKNELESEFEPALRGKRGSEKKFLETTIRALQVPASGQPTIEELRTRASSIFDKTPTSEQEPRPLDGDMLIRVASSELFRQPIHGASNSALSGLIEQLDAAAWVRSGIAHLERSQGACPFCQQEVPDALRQHLADYFDETYDQAAGQLLELEGKYESHVNRLETETATLLEQPPRGLSAERFSTVCAKLEKLNAHNLELVAKKRQDLSLAVSLDDPEPLLSKINSELEIASAEIRKHNELVANLKHERATLSDDVWTYIAHVRLAKEGAKWTQATESLDKAILSIETKIKALLKRRQEHACEIAKLEAGRTSVEPTIQAINKMLESFGFRGFSLNRSGNDYSVVRSDGSPARKTLSEGENTFLTFLYFFHLVDGSTAATGQTGDRLVVLDDPISSLDADILFVVSALVRRLVRRARDGSGSTRQVILLTHNLYFQKEVTYRQQGDSGGGERFWIVRKANNKTFVEVHSSNPIRTAYELLWTQARAPEKNKDTIQNTYRRILENYFKILGGIGRDEVCEKFEGQDRICAEALFSWINAGSHDVADDLYLAMNDDSLERFSRVFRQVFEKMGHQSHYEMMMAISPPTAAN